MPTCQEQELRHRRQKEIVIVIVIPPLSRGTNQITDRTGIEVSVAWLPKHELNKNTTNRLAQVHGEKPTRSHP